MGLIVATGLFFSVDLLMDDDDDFDVVQFKHVKDVQGIGSKPLLSDYTFFVVTQFQMYSNEIVTFLKMSEALHKDNNLCLLTDRRHVQDIKSKAVELNIPIRLVSGNYLDIEVYKRYCYSVGLYRDNVIHKLHKALYGRLDASILVIAQYMAGSNTIDKLIPPPMSRNMHMLLHAFLGTHRTKPTLRLFGKLIREEHPNYVKAILLSQIGYLLKMKESEYLITNKSFDYRDADIPVKFFRKYESIITRFSLPTILTISKCIGKCRSKSDLLLLHHNILQGGLNLYEQEAHSIRYPNII